jgi:hypothetical protein
MKKIFKTMNPLSDQGNFKNQRLRFSPENDNVLDGEHGFFIGKMRLY